MKRNHALRALLCLLVAAVLAAPAGAIRCYDAALLGSPVEAAPGEEFRIEDGILLAYGGPGGDVVTPRASAPSASTHSTTTRRSPPSRTRRASKWPAAPAAAST